MKIAFVYDVIYPYIKGGVEKRIWELSTKLVSKGHEVHIYGMKYWDGDDTLVKDGVIMHGVCKAKKLYKESGRRSIKQALYFTSFLPFELFKERYDVVDCQSAPYFPAFICRIYCTLKRVPFIITWHEVWGSYWIKYLGLPGYLAWFVENICFKLAIHNFSVSESTKKELEKNAVNDVVVVPNGVDINYFKSIKPSEKASDVIFLGRLIKDKNVDILLDAVDILRKKIPKIRVLIVGDGPEKTSLEEKALKLGLKSNVDFTGFLTTHDQAIALLKSSKIFAFPSTREGFGIVAIEANACGLPVITVKHEKNAAVNLITDGVNGIKTNLNAQEFANAIEKLLMDNKLLKEMSVNARESTKGYDWVILAEKLVSEYARVLNK